MNRPPITPEMRARARKTPNAWLHVVDPNHRTSTAIPPAEAVVGRYLVDSRGEITDQYVPNPRYLPIPPPPAHPATRPPAATATPPAHTRLAAPSRVVGGPPVPAHGAASAGAAVAGPAAPAHLAASPRPAPPQAAAPPATAPGATAPGTTAPATDQQAADPEPANELEAVLRLAHQGELDQDDLLAAVLAAELVLPADPVRPPRGHLVTRGAVVDAFASPKALPGDWPPRWHRFTGVELAVVFDRLGEPLRLNLADSSGLAWEIASDALVRALRSAVRAG